MKALTLWQPWASLVISGEKKLETRSWATQYRGRIAVHAAARWSRNQLLQCYRDPFARVLAELGHDGPEDLARGAVLGEVDLVDCLLMHRTYSGCGKISLAHDPQIAPGTRERAGGDLRARPLGVGPGQPDAVREACARAGAAEAVELGPVAVPAVLAFPDAEEAALLVEEGVRRLSPVQKKSIRFHMAIGTPVLAGDDAWDWASGAGVQVGIMAVTRTPPEDLPMLTDNAALPAGTVEAHAQLGGAAFMGALRVMSPADALAAVQRGLA